MNEDIGKFVKVRYLEWTSWRNVYRTLRTDESGKLYVLINRRHRYVKPLLYQDTGKVMHYVSN